ncbi:MAG: flagellar basal body rod protein FlgB [Gammaproteobacteria bacterium]
MDSIFGLSEKALKLSEDRSVLLSNNVVNSSTPNFKARDIDFQKVLKQEASGQDSNSLAITDKNHLQPITELGGGEQVMYRVPNQKSLDGNTVDPDIERKDFIENALHYQVNLTFIQNKSEQLMKAIKGD